MPRSVSALMWLSLISAPVLAQTYVPIKPQIVNGSVTPNPAILPGGTSPAQVGLYFEFYKPPTSSVYNDPHPGCDFTVDWGDRSAIINASAGASQMRSTWSHAYAKTGLFYVQVRGAGVHACTGSVVQQLTVQLPPPSAKAGAMASDGALKTASPGMLAGQAASREAADAAAKTAAQAAERASKGPTAADRESMVRAAELALNQRKAEFQQAQALLDAATNDARVAARALVVADSLNNVCLAGPNTYTGTFRQMAFASACNSYSGWKAAWDKDAAAKALVPTRTAQLKAADAAVAKATDDLNKAKNAAKAP